MSFDLREHDVSLVKELATSAGIAPERVTALQRRAELRPDERDGAPYAMLFGNPEGIRRLLTALAGADVAKEVHAATAPVVVVGRKPQVIRPLLTTWPNVKTARLGTDGLIIVKAEDRIGEATLAALESLGTIELGVLVSPLSQPLNQNERQLARALAGVIETIRVAILGHPAQEASAGEVAELADYARVQVRDAGFGPARFDGALVWMGENTARGLPCEAASPADLIAVSAANAGRNRDATLAVAVGQLLDAIEGGLKNGAKAVGLPATEQDLDRLVGQFDGHIQALGKTMRELVEARDIRTTEQGRAFLVEKVQGWINGQNLAATTLTLAEKFRPGTKACVAAAVAAAAPELVVEPPPKKASTQAQTAEATAAFAFLARHAWARGVAAVALGLLALLVGAAVIPLFGIEAWASRLGALGLALLTGLAAYFVLGEPWVVGQGQRPGEPAPPKPTSPLKGWPLFAEKLAAAFAAHMRNEGGGAALRSIAELRSRLVEGSTR
jgi:hypothetical protein